MSEVTELSEEAFADFAAQVTANASANENLAELLGRSGSVLCPQSPDGRGKQADEAVEMFRHPASRHHILSTEDAEKFLGDWRSPSRPTAKAIEAARRSGKRVCA